MSRSPRLAGALALAVLLPAAPIVAAGDILYVDADAAPNGNGTSWSDAFDEVHEALDAAAGLPGVTAIWVAEGRYTPATNPGGRENTLALVANVALLGGFAGDETDEARRDPAAHVTVLSGDFLGNDIAVDADDDDRIEFMNYQENALNVVTATDVTGARVDGFTIEGGNADYDGAELRGGGAIFLLRSEATIEGCVFRFNTAGIEEPDIGGFGGAIFVLGGDVTVRDCLFEDNRGMNGGGLAIGSRDVNVAYYDVTALIEGCTFRRCFSDFQTGGAMWTATGDPLFQTVDGTITVRACVFEDGFAEYYGAWTDQNTPHLLVEDCAFRGNRSLVHGGAFAHGQSAGPDVEPAIMRRCTFEDNVTGGGGAALFVQATNIELEACAMTGNEGVSVVRTGPVIGFQGGGRSLTMVSCLIADNDGVGVITDDAPVLALINTTVARNVAPGLGLSAGGVVADIDAAGQLVIVDNSILWGNEGDATGEAGQIQVLDGAADVNWSIVDGLTGALGGTGNLGADPSFTDAPNGDYRLAPGSPAIDAADSARVPEGADADLAGAARFVDDPATRDTGTGGAPIVDMGAYEFQVACAADVDGSGDVGFGDLLEVLSNWGACPGCAADLDGDELVGFADLLIVLSNWGPCAD